VRQQRFAEGDHALLGSHAAPLDHEEVLQTNMISTSDGKRNNKPA
jgi:hypothetical protein